jgi:hypothetical protein
MRRRETTIDPVVAAELDALEAALAGDPAAEPELTELVREVRAEAPTMAPEFREQLDERVQSGFARAPRARRRLSLPSFSRRSLLPALGVAGCLLAALVAVLVATGGSGDDGTTINPVSGSGDAALQAQPGERQSGGAGESAGDSAAAGGGAEPAPTAKSVAPSAPGRRVERTTRLELTTTDVQRVADGVVRATQTSGGFVQLSQVRTGDGNGSATFVLRVPTAKLDDALAALSKLGHVRALEQSADDITGAYDSASARLQEARAERRGLLRALARATTGQEVSSLRARIADNRRELQRRQREFNAVRSRANLATIQVDVIGRARKEAAAPDGGSWTPGDALRDAVRVLEVSAGVAVIALAVLVPLTLLGLAARFAAAAWRRRRREAAMST